MSDADDLDRLAGLLGVWAADSAARDAAGARTRQRWLAEQAAAEATLAGALVDLAEAGQPCVVRTADAAYTGVIDAVGVDCCVVGRTGAPPVVVALDAVVAVDPAGPPSLRPGATAMLADRAAPLQVRLGEVASVLAADRMHVALHLRGGTTVTGTLVLAGTDVLALVSPGADRRPRLVAVVAIAAIAAAPLDA